MFQFHRFTSTKNGRVRNPKQRCCINPQLSQKNWFSAIELHCISISAQLQTHDDFRVKDWDTGHVSVPLARTCDYLHTSLPTTTSCTVNSLSKVLFAFPSRYLFYIGLRLVSSIRWNIPPLWRSTITERDSTYSQEILGETVTRSWVDVTSATKPPRDTTLLWSGAEFVDQSISHENRPQTRSKDGMYRTNPMKPPV